MYSGQHLQVFSASTFLFFLMFGSCLPPVIISFPMMSGEEKSSAEDEEISFSSSKPSLGRFVKTSIDFLKNLSCDDVPFMLKHNCQRIQATPLSSMALYMAEPTLDGRKYRTEIPSSMGQRFKYESHDGVITIDPTPERRRSPHLVMTFFIDFNRGKETCEFRNGIYLENGECLTLGLQRGCNNLYNMLLASAKKRIRYAKKCENKHLPIVHLYQEEDNDDSDTEKDSSSALSNRDLIKTSPIGNENLLRCSNVVSGFIDCDSIRRPSSQTLPISSSSSLSISSAQRNLMIPGESSSSFDDYDDESTIPENCNPILTNTPWRCSRNRHQTSSSDQNE